MEKKFLVIANWKSNNPQNWSIAVPENVEVAVALPFPLLPTLKDYSLCAQDVSMFESGPYTGEVSAEMLKSLGVKYCLVGHSERRKYFGETNEIVQKKVAQLEKNNIIPIVCAQNFEEIPKQVQHDTNNTYIMYEPAYAISTNGQYHAEAPEKINAVLNTFPKNARLLYGGSVNPENIKLLIANCPLLIGFVVGHASLNPETFSQICASF